MSWLSQSKGRHKYEGLYLPDWPIFILIKHYMFFLFAKVHWYHNLVIKSLSDYLAIFQELSLFIWWTKVGLESPRHRIRDCKTNISITTCNCAIHWWVCLLHVTSHVILYLFISVGIDSHENSIKLFKKNLYISLMLTSSVSYYSLYCFLR